MCVYESVSGATACDVGGGTISNCHSLERESVADDNNDIMANIWGAIYNALKGGGGTHTHFFSEPSLYLPVRTMPTEWQLS